MYVGLLAIWLPGRLAAGVMAASFTSAVLLRSVRAACDGNLDHLILMQLSASKTVRGPNALRDVRQCTHASSARYCPAGCSINQENFPGKQVLAWKEMTMSRYSEWDLRIREWESVVSQKQFNWQVWDCLWEYIVRARRNWNNSVTLFFDIHVYNVF